MSCIKISCDVFDWYIFYILIYLQDNFNRQPFLAEICVDFLNGSCVGKCLKVHDHHNLPYSWQHKKAHDSHWRFFDLASIETLENAYSVASNASCQIRTRLDDSGQVLFRDYTSSKKDAKLVTFCSVVCTIFIAVAIL